MRLATLALLVTISTQAGAECGKLCDAGWWANATTADVYSEMAKGADVTARNLDGSTPLHSAAAHGTAASIDILVAAGADVHAGHECGSTPLHKAAAHGTAETTQALLAAGSDVMEREADGWTPLHRAASCFLVILTIFRLYCRPAHR